MIKKLLTLSVIASFTLSTAQVTFENNKLVKDGVSYKLSKYRDVFDNPTAETYFAKARANYSAASGFAYAGGFSLGFGLAQLFAKKEKTTYVNGYAQTVKKKNNGWPMIGIGAGLFGVSIPFGLAAKKNADKAIQAENGDSVGFKPYFRLENGSDGIKLSYNF